MASNLVRFCTAALAGSIIGIAYERWPQISTVSSNNWPSLVSTVMASAPIVPRTPDNGTKSRPTNLELNPKTTAENLKQSSKYGLPSKDNIRLFNDFIISYDRRLRAPVWVIEHLNADKLKQNPDVSREYSKFKEDKTLHEYFRATLSDFHKSSFDRGHLAAAGNHKKSQDDLDQTFLLSNISPQVQEFNRGGWERLETYVRWRAKRSKDLYVVTGPLYLPMKARDGNLYVTYRVIGDNHVSVPTHYYKVILYETKDEKLFMEAFLMPNDAKINGDIKLDDYRVTIDSLDMIERAAGVIFFDQLPRNKVEAPRSLPESFREKKLIDK